MSRFVQLSHLRKLQQCEQVAAVCYRVRDGGIEFLLVQTRGSGRWTFPKGGIEPGLTHAQAAALEAFEEAGVHGRIEEASFTRYLCRKGARKSALRSDARELTVSAHLCEVLRLGTPKESNRNRTWFSVKDARRRLRDGRESDEGAEFARVIDRALTRIQRLLGEKSAVIERGQEYRQKDALERVQIEAAGASFIPQVQRRSGELRPPSLTGFKSPQQKLLLGEVLQFSPEEKKRSHSLGSGTRNR
jgi:8-oxo-dGTP pyrophosphatase MutT (NUDIX family)